jgi:tetratricopeptide (TPR) repeat protein
MTRKTLVVNPLEAFLAEQAWPAALKEIDRQLQQDPDNHWLLSRRSDVLYEMWNYESARQAAEQALAVVPDCPLALWSYAGALDMLGRTEDAGGVYIHLIHRGAQQLSDPDADADECWEDAQWTLGLVADCMFRIAGCLARLQRTAQAFRLYAHFLSIHVLGARGLYSRKEAVTKIAQLSEQLSEQEAERELPLDEIKELATLAQSAWKG